VSFFPQRVFLTRFGRCAILGALATKPAHCVLSNDVVCLSVADDPKSRAGTSFLRKPLSKSIKQIVRMPQRASIVLPSTGLPDPIRALSHPWRACHETSALCLEH